MEEKYVFSDYPSGLKLLAEKLDLPIPVEETEKRENYIFGLINAWVRL